MRAAGGSHCRGDTAPSGAVRDNAHVRTNFPKEPKSTNMKRKQEQTNDDIKPLVVERSEGRGLARGRQGLFKRFVCLSVCWA